MVLRLGGVGFDCGQGFVSVLDEAGRRIRELYPSRAFLARILEGE